MKKLIKYLSLLIIVFFGFFIALKMNAEDQSFVLALNQIVNSLISEVWEFVSNPTVFIVLVILIILTQNKQLVYDLLLRRVKKFKGFGFEAELIEIIEEQIGKNISNEPISNIDLENKSKLFSLIIRNLSPEWHELILRINGKFLSNDQFFTIFDSIIDWDFFNRGNLSYDRNFHKGYYASSLQLLLSFYGIIFSMENERECAKFIFDSEFIELLKKKNIEQDSGNIFYD